MFLGHGAGALAKNVSKIFQRSYLQALTGDEDRVQEGRPDRVLHGVVVDRHVAVAQVGREIVPALERVVARLAEFAFGEAVMPQDFQYAL